MKKYGNIVKTNLGNKTNHDMVTIRRTYSNLSDNTLQKTVVSMQYPNEEIFELVLDSHK